jgi:hypothetical protein
LTSFEIITFNPHRQNIKGISCFNGRSTPKKKRMAKKPIIPQKLD